MFYTFFSASISTVKAVETPPTNESMCTIPRESGDEIFISMIDNQYNISRHDENDLFNIMETERLQFQLLIQINL